VDDPERLRRIVDALRRIAGTRPVVLAAHPRTRKAITEGDLALGAVRLMDPLPYMDLLGLVQDCHSVITDSGGIQEETSVLGVPCFTVRFSTERPVTVEQGTNQLVPEPEDLPEHVEAARRPPAPPVIELWDGRAGERIAETLLRRLS
jgi:UDP-N-acetylglucosamine 2-epimerase (non-hydrolysing)